MCFKATLDILFEDICDKVNAEFWNEVYFQNNL